MGVRIQELPETTGIKKEDVLIVEDGQGTKKGTVQQLDETLGVSQLKEDLSDSNLLLNYEYTKIDKGVSSEGSFVENISSSGIIQLKRGQIIKLNANGWKNAYAMIAEYHGEGNLYTPLVISDVDGPKEYKYKATKDITVTCSFDGRYPAKI
ncbi:MAG: hypothetical protein MR967_01175, partial [Holdemanella sp.]|uniref:hypothetical protein n=1 Tax=Holdemanella sp. TaxID=1971762 RepID=UPI0025904CA2